MHDGVCGECGQTIEAYWADDVELWQHCDYSQPPADHIAYPSKPKPASGWSPDGIARLAAAAIAPELTEVLRAQRDHLQAELLAAQKLAEHLATEVARLAMNQEEAYRHRPTPTMVGVTWREVAAANKERATDAERDRDRLAALVGAIKTAVEEGAPLRLQILVGERVRDLIVAHEKEKPRA